MAKTKKKKAPGRILRGIGVTLLSLLMVITLTVDYLLFGMLAIPLDKLFITLDADETEVTRVTVNGLTVAESIEAEGAVLLENDGALPLASGTKVNLLGYASNSIVYGGSGSGGSNYTANRKDFVTALTEEGFEVNTAVTELYVSTATSEANSMRAEYTINELPATKELADKMGEEFLYTGTCSFESMKGFSDTAIIVIGRKGSEGGDLPVSMAEQTSYAPDQEKHYLELSDAESSLINEAKASFKNVIIIVNAANAMELGFLKDASAGNPNAVGDIDAALWIGDPGDVGTTAVAKILAGRVNPSGRTADIYPYAVESVPSYYNFSTYEYTNSCDAFANFNSHPAYLIEYQEGIYVGYRYFETRGVTDGEDWYQANVQYPFGYGKSYTDFTWEVVSAPASKRITETDTLTYTVKVTNTGMVAGKDVVELYYSAPYYSKMEGGSGIQKSAVTLGTFAKTRLLQPGESDIVTLVLPVENMVSYDDGRVYSTTGSYVLETGEYTIALHKDSHTPVDGLSYTYSIPKNIAFADSSSANGAENVSYVGKRTSDEVVAVNQFDSAAGDVSYLTRDTWEITEGTDRIASAEQLVAFQNALVVDGSFVDGSDAKPTFGAKNGLSLKDVRGKDYDDPVWEQLLDQLTLDDISKMLGANGWGAPAIKSVGKPQTYDMDGPSVLSYALNMFFGDTLYKAVSYPCPVVIASTWSNETAASFGDAISQEGNVWDISGWYAPGANTHRNPFSGRNFEYYSEDPILSGQIAASVVGAAQNNGMYCYVKHFALNERETHRYEGLCTWASEQTMREIYLAPFESSVKDGNATGIMSSYNNLGTTWAGASQELLTNVLRNEWGFQGTVVTDNIQEHGFMSIDTAVAAGGTTLLYGFGQKNCDTLLKTASGQKLLREAAHQYLYTVANSYALENTAHGGLWRTPAAMVSAAIYVITIGGITLIVMRGKKKKRQWEAENEGE